MDEFSFIDSIKQTFYKQSTLKKGIGDDAAVFRTSSEDVVTAVDTFVEHVHFTRETMEPYHIGYRALAANLSDLAAMGAKPAFYLVSIVIPKTWAPDELEQIFAGMKDLASPYQMDLIGGDTVSGSELVISITVIGYTEKDNARYRSSAVSGDIVFVTGTLGDSQAGFHILSHPGEYEDANYFIKRHRLPSPKVDFARKLSGVSRLTLNDISDGIANEAAEIAVASNAAITLMDERIPTSPSYQQFPGHLQHQWKYFGGEDFELIGTVASSEWETVQDIAAETNTKISKIGYVSDEGNGTVFLDNGNKKTTLEKQGYTHLK